MATTTVTLTGDVADAIGIDFDTRRTKVYVRYNTSTVVTDSGPLRLGGGGVTPETDGTFELPDVVASTSLVENLQATVVVDYPDKTAKGGRGTATFGPYDLTGLSGTVDIRTLEAVQYLDASRASVLVSEMEALRDETQAAAESVEDLSGIATPDAVIANRIETPGSLTETALSATIGAALEDVGGSGGSSHSPTFLPTMETAGSINGAPGARTGLATTTMTVVAGDGTSQAQGYLVENVATGVSGTSGGYTLTVTDTTTLATLDGAGTAVWDCAILNSDGRATTNTVLDVSGGTVTLLNALPHAITGGQLSSRVDSATGQHLSKIGTKALAQHIAGFSPLVSTRGGIIEGQWDTLPPTYRTLWAKNAALTSYGVSNSAAPLVQSSLLAQSALTVYDTPGLYRRPNATAGGVMVGCHAAGHGATAVIRTGRRPVVIEFATGTERSGIVAAARIQVTATAPDGTVIYDRTVSGGLRWHRIPVTGVDSVTLAATNTDGAIYYLHLGQFTVREAGTGATLAPKKALLLGDSYTQYYDHLLGTELADALNCQVATFGKGGMTTDWGIAWLDTALAANPGCDTVILHFFTNDLNNLQSQTMTVPGGGSAALWPNGLTTAQAQARWIAQTRKLVSMIQQRGLRPVVVMPGVVNAANQIDAAIHIEQPRLLDWTATATELADSAAYINTVGKVAGASVKVGTVTKTATGPAAADAWVDTNGDALFTLQRTALSVTPYLAATGVVIGTDTNADGLSDGFLTQDVGTVTGDTYTPSIVSGNQRFASAWAASGADGQRRLRMNATVVAGREYLVLFDLINATASQTLSNSFSDITGSAVLITASNGAIAVDGSGNGQVYYRATANASGSKYASISRGRTNGGSHTMDVRKAVVVDLTTMLAANPNLSAKTTAELVAFILERLA